MILKEKVEREVWFANAEIQEIEPNWTGVVDAIVKAGSPVDGGCRLANNENAIGLLAETINNGDTVARVIVAGDVDFDKACETCGIDIIEDVKTACSGIEWRASDYVVDKNGGGEDKEEIIVGTLLPKEEGGWSCDKTFEDFLNAGKGKSKVEDFGFVYDQIVYTEEDIRFALVDTSVDTYITMTVFDFMPNGDIEKNSYTVSTAGVVITASENQTVKDYSVPKLTASQVQKAYNAIVGGKSCTVIDATETCFYAVRHADIYNDDIVIGFDFFNTMYLEYTSDGLDVTTEGYNVPAPINYSTSEQDTGLKWIDGRRIYQRTFSGTYSANTTYPTPNDDQIGFDENIALIINHYGMTKRYNGDGSFDYFIPISSYDGRKPGEAGDDMAAFFARRHTQLFIAHKEKYGGNISYWITIQYVKDR